MCNRNPLTPITMKSASRQNTEYPRGYRLVIINLALCLGIFVMALGKEIKFGLSL
jgi:hypothetical protein